MIVRASIRPLMLAAGLAASFGHAAQAQADKTGELRIAPTEFDFSSAARAGTGTSGIGGIQTVVLKGDPNGPGLYTIMLRVPPHTRIAPHTHPDDRVATVVRGLWNIGYGDRFDSTALKPLPPGSFYTEPAGRAHFAETGETPVIVQITGVGPSGLTYIDAADDPRKAK
ncbi:MAG TPA: cupin domain-containing protein [Alphaproteobacteria bacterium]|nr:cupin domain-containing protein [Alphaproteobacteria bacterium]